MRKSEDKTLVSLLLVDREKFKLENSFTLFDDTSE